MLDMNKYFAALDAGSEDITLVAARWGKNGECSIEGSCRSASKGLRKGVVTDAAAAIDSIAGAVDKLRKKTGKNIQEIYAAVSSTSVNIIPSSGTLLLSKYGREITDRDVSKCVDIASTVKMPIGTEPLHRIIRSFSIDSEKGIKNPLSLEGVKLGADVNILTVDHSVLNNMTKCISQAGLIPAGFVFSGLASSYRALTDEEKTGGVALVDIGKDLTEVVFFFHGIVGNCKVLSLGTSDICSENEGINRSVLEELLVDMKDLPGWDKINKVVVIGGGALVDGMIELLDSLLEVPTQAGTCIAKPFEDLPQGRAGYVCSLGVLDYLQERKLEQKLGNNPFKRGYDRVLGFVDRYF
ncbi:MAG: hypothetical protein HQ594_02015 [Candidatus Omnitrophica bacterium]|nr:hypothetical protein [Candidatus Omnitrophota bacterium]